MPSFGSNRHGSRGEVLYLFQMEIETFGDDRQFCHVFCRTSRMTTDEIRNDLLAKIQFLVDFVEYFLEIIELSERWLSHDVKYTITGMLGSHFQASAYMFGYQFAGIFLGAFIDSRVFAFVKQ